MKHIPRLIDRNCFRDKRGGLCVLEGDDLPFAIQRVYYLFDVPFGAIRGEHGHKKLEQLIICMNGICDITLNDGYRSYEYRLERPTEVLYIPAGMWRQLHFREPSTVCCVLASAPYDKEDYLFSYEDFQAWVQTRSNGGPVT